MGSSHTWIRSESSTTQQAWTVANPNAIQEKWWMKEPLDHRNYARDKRSVPIHVNLPDGCYVFVRDVEGTVFVLPDAPHLHPKVLGQARPARYAGDLTKRGHVIKDLTNLSGTFQFDDAEGLLEVVTTLEFLGFTIEPGAVRLFSHTDGRRPKIIR